MRTMVRAVLRQESKVRKGIDPDIGIGTGIAENLKSNGKVQEGRDQTPRANSPKVMKS